MKITESEETPKPEIVFPALFKHKSEPTLVVRFFSEIEGVVIDDPSGINSLRCQRNCSHWANCITSGHWEHIPSYTMHSAKPAPQKPLTFADVKEGQCFRFSPGGHVWKKNGNTIAFTVGAHYEEKSFPKAESIFAIYPEAELKLGPAVNGKGE